MGSPRTKVCRPRGHQEQEKVNQYRGKLGWTTEYKNTISFGKSSCSLCHTRLLEHPIVLAVQDTTSLDLIIASLGGFLGRKGDPSASLRLPP
jgi:hypothetical protein